MVKQRMGSADVAGECACLRKQLLGLRVANLYDLNPKVRHAWPNYAMHGPGRRVAARQSTGLYAIAKACISHQPFEHTAEMLPARRHTC